MFVGPLFPKACRVETGLTTEKLGYPMIVESFHTSRYELNPGEASNVETALLK